MRYYFAGRYSRHAELAGYRDQLVLAVPGSEVTSRWLDLHGGELEASYTPEALAANPAACWRHGLADMDDLIASQAIVSFTGAGGGGKGGRHIEHGIGMVMAWGTEELSGGEYRLIVVGPRENIFHCHPATEVYPTWVDFLRHEVMANGERLARQYHPGLIP